jgi:hypothetical protein
MGDPREHHEHVDFRTRQSQSVPRCVPGAERFRPGELDQHRTKAAPFPTPVVLETLDTSYKTPVTYNYNLAFEREVMPSVMVRAAYVGSRSRNGGPAWR